MYNQRNEVGMKLNLLLGCVAVAALVVMSSCGDDDPPPKAGITFEVTGMEVFESDGTVQSFHPLLFNGATGVEIQVKVVSDKALDENAVIGFTVSGTATKNSSSNPVGDYEFVASSENVTLEKGATSALIKIKVFEDVEFEIDEDDNLFETIILNLSSVVSGPAVIGDQDTHTITIKEDDIVVILDWDVGDGTRGDVDMDLLLQLENELVRGSVSEGNDFEAMNIPGGFPPGTYGLSYTYYSGTSDDLEFASIMFSTVGTLNGTQYVYPDADPLIFIANYTLENINEWDAEGAPFPKIVQTMVKGGINYTNISQITVPVDGGSRIKSRFDFDMSRVELLRKVKSASNLELKKTK
jgi:hypothetical protein